MTHEPVPDRKRNPDAEAPGMTFRSPSSVLERGAERFVAELPPAGDRVGSELDHLPALVDADAAIVEARADFPRILVVMAAQPATPGDREMQVIVDRARRVALARLCRAIDVAFDLDPACGAGDRLARLLLAALAGAVLADHTDPDVALHDVLEHLPAALVAARRALEWPARGAHGQMRSSRPSWNHPRHARPPPRSAARPSPCVPARPAHEAAPAVAQGRPGVPRGSV